MLGRSQFTECDRVKHTSSQIRARVRLRDKPCACGLGLQLQDPVRALAALRAIRVFRIGPSELPVLQIARRNPQLRGITLRPRRRRVVAADLTCDVKNHPGQCEIHFQPVSMRMRCDVEHGPRRDRNPGPECLAQERQGLTQLEPCLRVACIERRNIHILLGKRQHPEAVFPLERQGRDLTAQHRGRACKYLRNRIARDFPGLALDHFPNRRAVHIICERPVIVRAARAGRVLRAVLREAEDHASPPGSSSCPAGNQCAISASMRRSASRICPLSRTPASATGVSAICSNSMIS